MLVPLTTQSLLANWTWQIGVLFFLGLAVAMLPAVVPPSPAPSHAAMTSMSTTKTSRR